MKLNYNMPDVDNFDLSITVTMKVNQWRNVMRSSFHSDQEEFKNLVAGALGDVARLSKAEYEQKETT